MAIQGYIQEQLNKYEYSKTKILQYEPHAAPRKKSGEVDQEPTPKNELPTIFKGYTNIIHQIFGSLLFYVIAADITLIKVKGSIEAQQNYPTENTEAFIH